MRDRHGIIVACILSILIGLVVTTGCGPRPLGPEVDPISAEVKFHIDWPPMQFSKESIVPSLTTDIVIRIAKSDTGVGTGYHEHVMLGRRWVTMSVAPGDGYNVEFICLRRAAVYVPIGYGIRKDLSFTADSTNYVEVDLEPIHLILAKPDTIHVGDDLELRLTARNPYMADLSRYLATAEGITIGVDSPVPWIEIITFRLVSSGDFTTVWEWNYRFILSGRLHFFRERAPADWGRQFRDTNFFKAFQVRIEPAWSPRDFGVLGTRFTVVISDATNADF